VSHQPEQEQLVSISSISPAAPLVKYLMRPLEPWLQDPATEDFAINRPGEAWVYQHGAWVCNRVPLDYEDLESIAILAGALRRQEVGPETPLLDEKLPDGERLCVCLPPAVPHGTISLTLRKHQDTVIPLREVNERYCTERFRVAQRADRAQPRAADGGLCRGRFRKFSAGRGRGAPEHPLCRPDRGRQDHAR
jgi:hypothetical protein